MLKEQRQETTVFSRRFFLRLTRRHRHPCHRGVVSVNGATETSQFVERLVESRGSSMAEEGDVEIWMDICGVC